MLLTAIPGFFPTFGIFPDVTFVPLFVCTVVTFRCYCDVVGVSPIVVVTGGVPVLTLTVIPHYDTT